MTKPALEHEPAEHDQASAAQRSTGGSNAEANASDDSIESSVPGKPVWLRLPSIAAIFLVRMYQRGISPLIGAHCRYTPTCSSYYIQAVEKYGLIRGSLKGAWRICRCNPFGGSGHDPP